MVSERPKTSVAIATCSSFNDSAWPSIDALIKVAGGFSLAADMPLRIDEALKTNSAVTVIAAGVKDRSVFTKDEVHKVLNAWGAAPNTVLLFSEMTGDTQKAVDSWPGWQNFLPARRKTLSEAIIVDDTNLITNSSAQLGEKLKACAAIAEKLHFGSPKPSKNVIRVDFTPHKTEIEIA